MENPPDLWQNRVPGRADADRARELGGPVLVAAGEASGDQHAGDLVRALGREAPGLTYFGLGGDAMRNAGVEIVEENRELAVMGLAEVAGSLGRAWSVYRRLVAAMESRQVRGVVLVDFPDFNLRLARAARRRGIPVVYFISPQVWAWRARRVLPMARDVNRVICILPFEVGFYRRHGVGAVYVGHPLVDQARDTPTRDIVRRRWAPDAGRVLALVPGSRWQEVRLILPRLLAAAVRLRQEPGIDAVLIPVASTLDCAGVERAAGGPAALAAAGARLIPSDFLEVVAAADVALVASGTATLAAAVVGTPMVLGYHVHPLTYSIGSRLTRVPHVGLVNLVAGRRVVPELIQDDLSAENLAREARHLLVTGSAAAQREAFRQVRARLGPPGVFPRAAEAVLATLVRATRAPD